MAIRYTQPTERVLMVLLHDQIVFSGPPTEVYVYLRAFETLNSMAVDEANHPPMSADEWLEEFQKYIMNEVAKVALDKGDTIAEAVAKANKLI